MSNIIGAIENTVPISLFNRGLAGKIFAEVKQGTAKVVMKNNAAECVLMAPDEYVRLMNEVNDARLLSSAVQRSCLNNFYRGDRSEVWYYSRNAGKRRRGGI